MTGRLLVLTVGAGAWFTTGAGLVVVGAGDGAVVVGAGAVVVGLGTVVAGAGAGTVVVVTGAVVVVVGANGRDQDGLLRVTGRRCAVDPEAGIDVGETASGSGSE